jgi:hypothetical protein
METSENQIIQSRYPWSISVFSGGMVNTRVFLFSGETFKVAENAEEHGIN